MSFTKMHGLGNDFIVINNLEYGLDLAYFAARAGQLCDRHFGIGADGLVLIEKGEQSPFFMRVFNPDGSEAEMCGNAIRCLARYLWERGLSPESAFRLETGAGLKEVILLLRGKEVLGVRVDMGAPVLESTTIPVSGPPRHVINETIRLDGEELIFTAVSMGNPHCVIFLPDLTHIPWQRWGMMLENDSLFPRRTNVEFARILHRQEVEVRVWERGAGPTLACGTGACAVVVAGVLTGRLNAPAQVHLPGGTLHISWEEGAPVSMEGPAEEVFNGSFHM
ncbi:MAG TPA: diaminopimelate epimerase [Firmicutes bacterium]|nr:diaminopimelate epimerase [Bacillota bacterium]